MRAKSNLQSLLEFYCDLALRTQWVSRRALPGALTIGGRMTKSGQEISTSGLLMDPTPGSCHNSGRREETELGSWVISDSIFGENGLVVLVHLRKVDREETPCAMHIGKPPSSTN